MKILSYKTLREASYPGYLLASAPERILQFGEGNFLRAFADYFIDVMNERADFNSKVIVCQPIAQGSAEMINRQEGLYTLYQRGISDGREINEKRIISCISRCIDPYSEYETYLNCAKIPELRFLISNTTEAGIVYDPQCQFTDTPASSFPGKLTQFLYQRFLHFGSETGRGFVVLSCELIDQNGDLLKDCVLKYARQWELGECFISWLNTENLFCSTLVDRIVTGFPSAEAEALQQENQYEDRLLDTCEPFGLWVIEGPDSLKDELPFEAAGLPVIITADHSPYKKRKVRILNGAHTAFVPGAFLAGQDLVRTSIEDEIIGAFLKQLLYTEIIPTLDLPKEDLLDFAHAVLERFKNPFIDHSLLAICLNSTAKWKARVLPTLKDFWSKSHRLPPCITASFAFYLAFYRDGKKSGQKLTGHRGTEAYLITDEPYVLDFFEQNRNRDLSELVLAVCKNTDFWEEDLSLIPGFVNAVSHDLRFIDQEGTSALMRRCLDMNVHTS